MNNGIDKRPPRILIVDDEQVIRDILKDFLLMENYEIFCADNGEYALELLTSHKFDLVLSDLKMPVMGGLELLRGIKEKELNVVIIIMTGFGTVETAIDAMKLGAYDYILKPFKVEEVIRLVERALEKRCLEMENIQLKETLSLYRISEAISSSLKVDKILDLVVDTTFDESNADIVSLILCNKQGEISKKLEKVSRNNNILIANINEFVDLKILFDRHANDESVLITDQKMISELFNCNSDEFGFPTSLVSVPLKIQQEVIGMINVYSFHSNSELTEGNRKMLTILASRASSSIENARLYANLKESFKQTIESFARALEAKDPYTHGHSDRVTTYARIICEGLGLDQNMIEVTCQSALLHDIGKIGIRYEDLNKPGKLTPQEYEMFKSHVTWGKRILEPIEFLVDIVPSVYHHHEHYDGKGYPKGLKGNEIPLPSRILAIADTYDAMTSDRAYRKALPHTIAINELKRCSGTQFDPELVLIFLVEIDKYKKNHK